MKTIESAQNQFVGTSAVSAQDCKREETLKRATGGRPSRVSNVLGSAWSRLSEQGEKGLATAEYAIAMIAAAGFAGLLIAILKSQPVREALTSIIELALGTR